jgi:GT2 family glycosyltransferase
VAGRVPELSIVIPTIGRKRTLPRVLERLEHQTAPRQSFEVLVVIDAGEPDPEGVEATIGARGFALRVLRGELAGASGSRNAGWRAADAPLILFVDDDVLPEPALVAEHLAWHRRHPEQAVGVLGHVRWADELRVTPFMHWLENGVQFDYPNIAGIEAGWGRFYTANASVKRALLERVDGFDAERLPFGNEDLDLAYRMSKHGFRLIYNRAAGAEHLHPMEIEMWRRRIRRVAFAEHRFCRLHPEIPPYFQPRLARAASAPPATGRGRRLIRYLPRSFPLLGRLAWTSADRYYLQQLAPPFLEAWAEAERGSDSGAAVLPDLSERQLPDPAAGS